MGRHRRGFLGGKRLGTDIKPNSIKKGESRSTPILPRRTKVSAAERRAWMDDIELLLGNGVSTTTMLQQLPLKWEVSRKYIRKLIEETFERIAKEEARFRTRRRALQGHRIETQLRKCIDAGDHRHALQWERLAMELYGTAAAVELRIGPTQRRSGADEAFDSLTEEQKDQFLDEQLAYEKAAIVQGTSVPMLTADGRTEMVSADELAEEHKAIVIQ